MTVPEVTVSAFRPFYLHLAPRGTVEDVLRERIGEAAAPEHVDELIDTIWTALVVTVEASSYRMLVGEFHAFREARGLPLTTESDAALRLFQRHLSDSGNRLEILAGHPVYAERITTVVRHTLDAWAEMFTAYVEDGAALRAAGLVPPGPEGGDPVVRVTPTGSDAHNNSRQVLIVRLASGTRLAFKPRPLESDRFVRELYAAADPYLVHSLEQCVPLSVTVGSHGWQQFVEARALTESEEPARYFYRFGALCAIFAAIGACDLHHENLTARGEHPCLLDTETMLRADINAYEPSLTSTLTNQFKLSVISTMLLPVSNPQSHIDVDLSGVGAGHAQQSNLKRPVIRDRESDGISVDWEPVVIEQSGNVPRLGDTPLSAVDHFADLVAGYTDALAFVRSDAIGKILDAHEGLPVRTVLRPTMVYGRFLDASSHPAYLSDPAEARRLLHLVSKFPDTMAPEAAAFVREQEYAALNTGNIPLFLTWSDSVAVATHQTSHPGYFEMTPGDIARLGVSLNSDRSDRYHWFLLEELVGELTGEDDASGLSSHSVFGRALAAAPGSWWRDIAETLTDISVAHEGPDGTDRWWLGGIGPGLGAPTVTAGEFVGFHDFGGVATFLGRAARADTALGDAAAAADRGLTAMLELRDDALLGTAESVFSGASSVLLTRHHEVDADRLGRILDKIAERAASGELVTDLVNGPAGGLMVLLSHKEHGTAEVPLTAERLGSLADLVLSHQDGLDGAAWFDLAHGRLGLRWASARIGRVLGDPSLARAAADWLLARFRSGEETPHHGWCKGAAGLLLASAEILASAGRQDWLTPRRLAALVDNATRLPEDGAVDLSVCHGSSGVVQSLIASAHVLGDDSLLDRAYAYQEQVLGKARAHGFFTGARGRTSLPGYMLGWAGVGDTDLLLRGTSEGVGGAVSIPVALMSKG
ncbi:type 2 lantipeptide synthetase LanM [Streptomyces sp. OF3]|uniref:Type 2 lantipeptide synthetase LanM n=1 Tax=Streptomyces alkaliterrae TaxID=2213162 RepID=A0A7W3WKX0_9ACTN|nr:type 2 lanthipeptide synthetase LanM [Streptomyces alkaliterrae]MBB1254251.1 type 2 lantipeptide synthetase LanM [Streptomyces alkaliterrae]